LRQGQLVEHLRAAKVGDGPVYHWEARRSQPLEHHEVKLQAWRVEAILEIFPCFGEKGKRKNDKKKNEGNSGPNVIVMRVEKFYQS